MTHFSECIPIVKRHMIVVSYKCHIHVGPTGNSYRSTSIYSKLKTAKKQDVHLYLLRLVVKWRVKLHNC